MAVSNFKELVSHKGHEVVLVTYESPDAIWGVAVECEDCGVVLFDYDNDEMSTDEIEVEEMEIE